MYISATVVISQQKFQVFRHLLFARLATCAACSIKDSPLTSGILSGILWLDRKLLDGYEFLDLMSRDYSLDAEITLLPMSWEAQLGLYTISIFQGCLAVREGSSRPIIPVLS